MVLQPPLFWRTPELTWRPLKQNMTTAVRAAPCRSHCPASFMILDPPCIRLRLLDRSSTRFRSLIMDLTGCTAKRHVCTRLTMARQLFSSATLARQKENSAATAGNGGGSCSHSWTIGGNLWKGSSDRYCVCHVTRG